MCLYLTSDDDSFLDILPPTIKNLWKILKKKNGMKLIYYELKGKKQKSVKIES